MNERMTFEEAKARIIRLNEGGNLFDCENNELRISHLKNDSECACAYESPEGLSLWNHALRRNRSAF